MINQANPEKIARLTELCSRHSGEERLVRFPAPGGRPSINHYSRRPGAGQSELAMGSVSVHGPTETGDYVCRLARTDGGTLTRPSSATGFGDIKDDDGVATHIDALVGEGEVRVILGDNRLDGVEPRAAEHFARVVLTFLTRG